MIHNPGILIQELDKIELLCYNGESLSEPCLQVRCFAVVVLPRISICLRYEVVAIDTGFVQQLAHIAVDADKESLGQELHIS